MKPIQILVFVAATAVAAMAQNTNSTPQNTVSSTQANSTAKPKPKTVAATAAKPAAGSASHSGAGSSQNSTVKLIVPKTAAHGKTSGATVPGATASTSKPQLSAQSPPPGHKAAIQTSSTKGASSASKPGGAQKPQATVIKPVQKPVTRAKDENPAKSAKAKAPVAHEQPQVKVVPQKPPSSSKSSVVVEESSMGANNRRDPFVSIVRATPASGGGPACSVGKRCLFIPDLELKGIAKDPDGQMMAVVVSNARRAYFLRENDQVFNGSVQKITSDSVIFREFSIDHLGRESAHEVVKKLSRS